MVSSEALYRVGRVGLASLFILGGVNKVMTFSETGARMEEVGLSPAAVLLPTVIALELGAGLIVATGWRLAPFAAAALAVFTLATNVYFHAFWIEEGQRAELELSLFFKNVAIAGALLALAAVERGRQAARSGEPT